MCPAPSERDLFTTMLEIRAFEERVVSGFRRGEIPGFVHVSIGSEGVAAGVCRSLRPDDYMATTHRGHGDCLAKGAAPTAMMAEIYGKDSGTCRGRGGSMHIMDLEAGVLGANGIVGGGLGLATGAGLSCKTRGTDQVVVAFFGDGAANEGILHESLNLAAIWSLPVVYVCQNNGFADSTPTSYSMRVRDVASRAGGYGIPDTVVDGNDALAVSAAMREPIRRARAGEGPTLVEAKTDRLHGHYEGDPDRARDDAERAGVRARDPIVRLRSHLLAHALATEADLDDLSRTVAEKMDDAVAFARAASFPEPSTAADYAYPVEEPTR